MKLQSLREIYTVTQWKDGCVYRTRATGNFAWFTLTDDAIPYNVDNTIYASLKTTDSAKLKHNTIRRVSDDTPDMVVVTRAELGL